jgi:hypothetical protein
MPITPYQPMEPVVGHCATDPTLQRAGRGDGVTNLGPLKTPVHACETHATQAHATRT